MYAIIGEDDSDVEMLCTLVRRIARNPRLTVKRIGYNGCGEMLNKAWKQIQALSKIGCTRFIICYDSDGQKPLDRYNELVEKVIRKCGVSAEFCALVPIQEIESWILADLDAVTKIIPTWRPTKKFSSPELEKDPKECLETLSRGMNLKPKYSNAMHNPRIAEHLDLEIILMKCSSSIPLFELVQGLGGNYPPPFYLSDSVRRKAIRAHLSLANAG